MLVTVKKPTFEPNRRNSPENLLERYEWFLKWKDTDLDFTKNCIFINEAGFNICMRNNWARSDKGSPAIVKIPQTRSTSHTIIGAIHPSGVIYVAMKKPPSKEKKAPKAVNSTTATTRSKKRKLAKGKELFGIMKNT